jgi:hypothetical protein
MTAYNVRSGIYYNIKKVRVSNTLVTLPIKFEET